VLDEILWAPRGRFHQPGSDSRSERHKENRDQGQVKAAAYCPSISHLGKAKLIGLICLKRQPCSSEWDNSSIHLFTITGHEPNEVQAIFAAYFTCAHRFF
jgi:hypothetical protein